MSAPKFTPGPWQWFKGERGCFVFFTVSDVANLTPAYVSATSAAAETMQANAYLIAAAPDLFNVLAAIVDEIDRRGLCLNDAPRLCAIDEGLIVQAMAALEKAKGGVE